MNSVRTTLGITFGVTLGFLVLLWVFVQWRESQFTLAANRLDYAKLYVQGFNVIVVSFFVGLLGILIPARLSEVQNNFERLKESRVAYSEAKTGVAYLPLRLCSLTFAEAGAFIQQVHFHKHQAQLYQELNQHVRHQWPSPSAWADEMYTYLEGFRRILEKHAADWDVLERGDRMRLLLDARSVLYNQLEKKTPDTAGMS